MRPEFGCGIHDCVFDTIDAALVGRLEREVRAALDRWEPRIECSTSLDFSRVETGAVPIDISTCCARRTAFAISSTRSTSFRQRSPA